MYDVVVRTTKANSAIVHAGFDAKEGSLKALLNVKGSEMMGQVTLELGVKYKNNDLMKKMKKQFVSFINVEQKTVLKDLK